MKASENCFAIIKEFEGYHTKLPNGDCEAYLDKLVRPELRSPGYKGLWTIGFGSTGPNVTEGTVWTRAQAEADLKRLVASHEKLVNELVKVPLDQNEFDALVSISFNLDLRKAPTLVKRLNEGDRAGAADAFLMYNKAGGVVVRGLTRRRTAERELFLRYTKKDVVMASTKLTVLQRVRMFIAGLGITWASIYSFLAEARQFLTDHAGVVALGLGVTAWIVFKWVESASYNDYKEGRYLPSGHEENQ